MANLTYNPDVFRVADELAAKRIICTPEPGLSTEVRWERETPYLADIAIAQLQPSAGKMIVDFGCGLGRLAKVLIERTGCCVLGVDISPEMRGLATAYVGSDRFSVASPTVFAEMCRRGFRADGALTAWVLQHVLALDSDIALLKQALSPLAKLFVVNEFTRVVPVKPTPEVGAWASDGQDVRTSLAAHFTQLAQGSLDPSIVGQRLASVSFWGTYGI